MTAKPGSPQDLARSPVISLRWWPQVTALLLILIELCWVVPWYQMVMQISYVASVPRSSLVLGGVMLSGYVLGYLMESLRIIRSVKLAVLAFILLAGLLLAEELLLNDSLGSIFSGLVNLNPGALLVLLFVLWMWWRGVALSQMAIRPITAWRRFELGLLLFMAFIFTVVRLGGSAPAPGWFMFFLFTGLLAVIFARVSYVGLVKGVTKNPFDRRWLVSTALILGGCIFIAAIFGSLLTGQYSMLLEWLAEGLKLLLAVVLFIAAIPGLLLSNLLGPLIPWLRQFLATPTPDPNAYPGPEELVLPPEMFEEPQPIPPSIQSLIFWGIVLVVLVLLFLRIRRSLGSKSHRVTEEPESLLKRGEANKLFRQALQDAVDGLAARLQPVRKLVIAARIRRIYDQLLDLCAELGRPRPVSRTPSEFLPVMGELFTEFPAELDLITQTYIRVRYGEVPEQDEEVQAIEAAWERINEQGQKLKHTGQHKLQTAETKEVLRTGV
jgi:hypothetical protein